jgi:hypothetical protein
MHECDEHADTDDRDGDAGARDEHELLQGGHGIGDRGGHRVVVEVSNGEGEHPKPALGQLPVKAQRSAASWRGVVRALASGCRALRRQRGLPFSPCTVARSPVSG